MVLVPAGVVTVISTTPEPEGDLAMMTRPDTTSKLRAALAPKSTAVAPERFVPAMATEVPPLAGPWCGAMCPIFGGLLAALATPGATARTRPTGKKTTTAPIANFRNIGNLPLGDRVIFTPHWLGVQGFAP